MSSGKNLYPDHSFGRRLRRVRDYLKLSSKKMAEFMEVSQPSYSAYENDKTGIPAEAIRNLIQHVDIDAGWLLTGSGVIRKKTDPPCQALDAFDFIPMAEARLNAGGGEIVPSERMKGLYAFRKEWLRKVTTMTDALVLVRVSGDSMSPTIQEGDVVMLDRGRLRISAGHIFAIGIDDTIIIKRIELIPGDRIRIISDNRNDYPPYEIHASDIRIIGQVVWYARQLVRVDY